MKALAGALVLGNTFLLSPEHPLKISAPSSDVWISNPEHLQAQALPNAVVLKGREPGIAHVTGIGTGAEARRVAVLSPTDYRAVARCPKLNLSAESVPLELESENQVDAALKCGFENLALGIDPSPQLQARFDAAVQAARQAGLRFQSRGWQKGRMSLLVRGNDPQVARTKLGPLAPFFDLELINGPKPGRTLIFELTLFEVSRSQATSLGLRLPDSVTATTNLSRPLSLHVVEPGLSFGADWAESHGAGRILAKPQLRTKPGEKAQFQSGGELPIKSSTAYSSSTSWKPYGLILELLPDANTQTGAPEVAVSLKLEMSEPDYSTAIDGVPGMVLRKLESKFDLRTEETTILSSMIQTRSGARTSGPAGLLNVPLIGDLLSNHKDDRQDLELWFGLKPTWDEIAFPNPEPIKKPVPKARIENERCPRWSPRCG